MKNNTFEKLTFMYDKMVDRYVLEKEQVVIYEIGKCLDVWSNIMLSGDFFYERANAEMAEAFREVGANSYSDLIIGFIEERNILENQRALYGISRFEYREEKRMLISRFYRNLQNFIEQDNIIENYAEPYIKAHKLNKILNYHEQYSKIEKQRKKQLKQRILTLALGGWILIPAVIFVNFDFEQSGNDLKLMSSLLNLAVFLILSLVFVGIKFFSVKRKNQINKSKSKKIINEILLVIFMFLFSMSISVSGAFTFVMAYPVITLLMGDCKRHKFDFNSVAEEIGLQKKYKR